MGYLRSFASGFAIFKLQEDTEDPALKAAFDEQILVWSIFTWSKTYVNSKKQLNQDFLNNNTGGVSVT